MTVISYFIGDRFILPQFNNTVATIADGVLAIAYLYAGESLYRWGLSFGEIVIIAVVLAIGEAFLHRLVFQSTAEVR